MNDLYLVDNSGKNKKHGLSGNGVDVSLDSGDLKATASSNPNPGQDGVIRSIINNQWTVEYSDGTNELYYIGVLDVVGNKTPEVHSFNLGQGAVNIRLSGNSLIVTTG